MFEKKFYLAEDKMSNLQKLNSIKGRILQAISNLESPRDKSRNSRERHLSKSLAILREQGVKPPKRTTLRNKTGREHLIWEYLVPLYMEVDERSQPMIDQMKQVKVRADRQRGQQMKRFANVMSDIDKFHQDVGLKVTIPYARLPESMTASMIEPMALDGALGVLKWHEKSFLIKSTNRNIKKSIKVLVDKFANRLNAYEVGKEEEKIASMVNLFKEEKKKTYYHVIDNVRHEVTKSLPKYDALTIPMKDRHSPKLITFDSNGELFTKYINHENDQCVLDYIYNDYILRYSQNKKLGIINKKSRLPYMSKEEIASKIEQLWDENSENRVIFSQKRCPVNSLCLGCDVCEKRYNALTDGVNVKQLELFCKAYKISLRVCDKDNRQFHSYISPTYNGVEAMMIVSENGHLYPITNVKFRKCLGNSGRYAKNKRDKQGKVVIKSGEHDQPKQYVKVSDDLSCEEILKLSSESPSTCFIFQKEHVNITKDIQRPILESMWLDLLCERNEYYQHGFKSTEMTEIFLPNKCMLTVNRDYDKVMEACNVLQIPFENQSLLKITNDLLAKFTSIESLSSDFNLSTYDAIKNDMPVGNWVKSYNQPQGTIDDLCALDFNKMYSSILEDKQIDWVKLDITSEITQFDGELDSENIYYVNVAENELLFQGNGWYFYDIVSTGLSDGLIKPSNVLYQIDGVKRDYPLNESLSKFVDFVYSKFGNSLGKELINPFIGNLGKSHSLVGKSKWTTSIEHACTQFCNENNDSFVFEREHKGKNVYCMESSKLVERHNQSLLIHRQIVQTGWLKVYKLIKEIGGNLISVKTDCVVVENPCLKSVHTSKQRGGYKFEKISPSQFKMYQKTEPIKCTHALTPKSYDTTKSSIKELQISDEYDTKSIVDTIMSHGNVLLTGRAGVGKSVVTKALIKQLRDDDKLVKCGAPTHVAKRLIDEQAQSVHNLFGYDILGKVHTVKFNDKQFMIIDEVSMMGIQFWREIIRLKRKQPNIIWVLVGDFNQLRAVGEEHLDVYKSQFLREIVDNHIDLKDNKRCTKDGQLHFDIMTAAIEGRPLPHSFPQVNQITMKKNLCYTNNTRKMINRVLMKRYKTDQAIYFETNEKHINIDFSEDGVIVTRVTDSDRQQLLRNEVTKGFQNMHVYEGLPIRCKKNHKVGDVQLVNGDTFIVQSYDDKFITVIRDYDNANVNIPNNKEFPYSYFPNYASTIHSAQGQTFSEPYCLHEMDRYDERLLYVALSRTTELSNIYVKECTDNNTGVNVKEAAPVKTGKHPQLKVKTSKPLKLATTEDPWITWMREHRVSNNDFVEWAENYQQTLKNQGEFNPLIGRLLCNMRNYQTLTLRDVGHRCNSDYMYGGMMYEVAEKYFRELYNSTNSSKQEKI